MESIDCCIHETFMPAIHEPLMNKLMKLICEWNERSDGWRSAAKNNSRNQSILLICWVNVARWLPLLVEKEEWVWVAFLLVGYGRPAGNGSAERKRTQPNKLIQLINQQAKGAQSFNSFRRAALFSSFLFKRNERKRKRRMNWNDQRCPKAVTAAAASPFSNSSFCGPAVRPQKRR